MTNGGGGDSGAASRAEEAEASFVDMLMELVPAAASNAAPAVDQHLETRLVRALRSAMRQAANGDGSRSGEAA